MSKPWYKNKGWAAFTLALVVVNLFVWGYRAGFYSVWLAGNVPDFRKPYDIVAGFALGLLLATVVLGVWRRQ